ncbi:unnamed protein product [Symbiodinium sp. CCMP2592]|nr:unnamed protein product [Symbiodinium sp. CCMP2592]CAE7452180.1 unnamed protein product [Symbiodinium sp. CCMP2592]CAE7460358.1 unnamed protein product [Symbiodinium sp. CCMP2592]CAE7472287.1 unnamed protein product [Symbiodinium sp. CCMP2592]CAE7472594.1 unnamed protein product [Symbiodinium sp. CCMP2592]
MSLPLSFLIDDSVTSFTAESDARTGQPTLSARFSMVLKMEIPALVELLSKTAAAEKSLNKSANRIASSCGSPETDETRPPIRLKPSCPPTAKVMVDEFSKRPTLRVQTHFNLDMDMAGLVELLARLAGLTGQPEKASSPGLTGKTRSAGDASKAKSRDYWKDRHAKRLTFWEQPIQEFHAELHAKYHQDYKWSSAEFEGEQPVFVMSREQQSTFRDLVFDPLELPERQRVTHANYKEADSKRFPQPEEEQMQGGAVEIGLHSLGSASAKDQGVDSEKNRGSMICRRPREREEGRLYPSSPGCKQQ